MTEKLGFHRGARGRTAFIIGNGIFMCLMIFIMLVPILKVLSDSFDAVGQYGVSFLPKQPSLDAYKAIISAPSLYRPFVVSIVVTILGTLFSLVVITIAAYVLTQRDMPGRQFVVYFLLFTMVFSGGLIPSYLLMKNLHLINTLWAVIIPLALHTYNIILMRSFFDGIPDSLPESAEIDGCSPFGIFWRIILPMSKPALAAIGLFCVEAYWNNFFNFVIYINDPKWYNFQVKLREMILTDDMVASSETQVYAKSLQNASIIVAIIPVMILYPFLQKHFVKGINLGAVKG